MTVTCSLCGNQEGDFVAIGLIDDTLVYLCRHGHIDATTYDIETGSSVVLTLGDNEIDEDACLYFSTIRGSNRPDEYLLRLLVRDSNSPLDGLI